MGLFSRNKDAAAAMQAEQAPFEALRRSPRNTRKPRASTASGATDFDAGAPLDPAEASKTRARRRLIGAVALALAAIVFVPMLFDRAPVVPNDDIALQIPDRDTPFEGRRGVPDAAKAPLRPSSELPASPTITAPAADAPVQDATSVAEPTSEKPGEPAPQPKAAIVPPPKAVVAEKPAEKVEKLAEKPVDKTDKSRPASTNVVTTKTPDDPRALAALEGKDDTVTSSAGDRQYAVQIAAFSAADRARGLRDQLIANGLKSYVESVSTAQGLRTRVRLGPFASRDAADRAKQKLKMMKLDGSVVPL